MNKKNSDMQEEMIREFCLDQLDFVPKPFASYEVDRRTFLSLRVVTM